MSVINSKCAECGGASDFAVTSPGADSILFYCLACGERLGKKYPALGQAAAHAKKLKAGQVKL